MSIVLQQERTLDDVVLGALQTFRNGCNFAVIFDRDKNETYLNYGCYGVHVNLCTGDEKLLYKWYENKKNDPSRKLLVMLDMISDQVLLPISRETERELLKRIPCACCGSPFFIPRQHD
jgi:hypothetical protein